MAKSSLCFSKHFHPSKSEASDCNILLSQKQSGKIRDFGVYPSIKLHVDGKLWRKWAADFWFIRNDGVYCIMESKRGWKRSDDRARAKMAHFVQEYPDTPLYINFVVSHVTSDGRLIAEAYKVPKKRKSSLVRSYNRNTHRWETVRIDQRDKSDRRNR